VGKSKTSSQALTAAERREEILRLRKRGLSYTEISSRMGIQRSACHRHVKTALAQLNEKVDHETEEYRRLESERLDLLISEGWAIHEKATDPDTGAGYFGKNGSPGEVALKALEQIRKAMADFRKLWGLDGPIKVEGSGPGGGPMGFTLAGLAQRGAELLSQDQGCVTWCPAAPTIAS